VHFLILYAESLDKGEMTQGLAAIHPLRTDRRTIGRQTTTTLTTPYSIAVARQKLCKRLTRF